MKTHEMEVILGDGTIFDVRVLQTDSGLAVFILCGTPAAQEMPIYYFKDEVQIKVWKCVAERFAKLTES